MKIDLLVVSGRTLDTKPCVLIQCENVSYVFNFPELTQRIFMEHKWKMLRMKQIFVTDITSSSIGGIPGMILTTFTGKKSEFGFTCPPKFSEILHQQEFYQNNPEFFPDLNFGEYKDEFLQVQPIQLNKTIAYSVQVCDEPGKFDVGKAKSLGLKPGPLFKNLQQGESVEVDGKIIEPSMVIGASIPGAKLLILDLKSEDEIETLQHCISASNSAFSDYDVIVHITQPEIFNTAKYQAIFTDSFKQYNEKNGKKQVQICFPFLDRITFQESYKLFSSVTNKRLLLDKVSQKLNECFTQGEIGLNYSITPSNKRKFTYMKLDDKNSKSDGELPFDYQLPEVESFAITFFGTGCHIPTKLRNVTGILIHLNGGFVALDPGEGFTGQMRRRFGIENANLIIKNLLFVWNSHSHGDHIFGLHELLEYHQQITDKKIPVFTDQKIINDIMLKGDYNVDYKNREIEDFVYKESNLEVVLNSFPVEHCEGSHGCVLTINNKWRVAFSGDHSVVKDDFVKKVGNCDILIHEATFSDDLVQQALEKKHSTIGQAILAGQQLSAKFIVLTHFSARYKLENVNVKAENLVFAFDFLSFKFENAGETCEECQKAFLEILKDNEENEK